jgi:phage gp16-like protein
VITNRQIALIHVAKSRIGMSDSEYRAMLSGYGVQSSKQLRQGQFDTVMKHFAVMGFSSNLKSKNNPAVAGQKSKPLASRDRLRAKISAILRDLQLTDSYADAIAKTRFEVDTWRWLKTDDLYKLTAMLSYHQQRHPERRHG